MRDASWAFPSDPASPSRAREHVREALASWGADEFEWATVTVVSELATNAVLHARTEFTVRLVLSDDLLRVEVSDLSPRLPRARAYSADATTGRGVSMLRSIAGASGVEPTPGGKTVWCELTTSDAGRTWRVDDVDGLDATRSTRTATHPAVTPATPPAPAEPVARLAGQTPWLSRWAMSRRSGLVA